MLTIPAPIESLLINQTHRFAYCWDIERTEGTHFRYTTHNHDLILADGNTYTPAGGLSATAIRKESGLREQNQEFDGVITTDEITHKDLRGGLFREAKVTQYLVDFRYPWIGSFQTIVYWIAETQFDGERWNAEVVGLTRRLKQKVGAFVGRTCKYDVGDSNCGINLLQSAYQVTNAIVTVVSEARRIFTASGIGGSYPTGWFDHGLLTWTGGENDELTADVKTWTQSTVTIELILPAPFDVVNGDTFSITAGCEKTDAICHVKYTNRANFGGDKYTPGTDKMIQSPAL